MYIVGLINEQGTKIEFDFDTIQGALDFIKVCYKLVPYIRRTLKYVLLHW